MDVKRSFVEFDFPTKSDLNLEDIYRDSSITRHAVQLLCDTTESYFQARFTFAREVADELLHYTWEKLNTGNWKDVSITWRQVYSYASLIKASSLCGLVGECVDEKQRHQLCQTALEACDMGLLMGAPILDNILSRLASALQSTCTSSTTQNTKSKSNDEGKPEEEEDDVQASKKQKTYDKPSVNPSLAIPTSVCPALLQFKTHYMDKKQAVIIQGAMDHWPARSHRHWSVDYLKQVAGSRTVPIEIGSKYTDENWSQALMTLSEFIDRFMGVDEQNSGSGTKGYLAQHQLFEQIPELKQDICIPDYCCLKDSSIQRSNFTGQNNSQPTINEPQDSTKHERCDSWNSSKPSQPAKANTEDVLQTVDQELQTKVVDECSHGDAPLDDDEDDVDINAWFGPGGTVSPLHHDPKHNCLAQVVGEKYVRLYGEEMTEFVYPHDSHLLDNTSQVNVEEPDYKQFPLFKQARYQECILKPGEMLYIPPKCWHYVRSLSTSFSVSFWWR